MFENLKIGEIARTVVRQVLEAGISDAELNNLRNPDYCKQYLGLNVPMLIPYEGEIVKRYYVEPVNVNGENYLLTNDWYETPLNNDRPKLLEWLQSQEKNFYVKISRSIVKISLSKNKQIVKKSL